MREFARSKGTLLLTMPPLRVARRDGSAPVTAGPLNTMSTSTFSQTRLGSPAWAVNSNLNALSSTTLEGQASDYLSTPATFPLGDGSPLTPTNEIGYSAIDAADLPALVHQSSSASSARDFGQGQPGRRPTANVQPAARGVVHKLLLQLKRGLSLAHVPTEKVAVVTPDPLWRPRMLSTVASCDVPEAEGGDGLCKPETPEESSRALRCFRCVCI
jgi:hypothetical protein